VLRRIVFLLVIFLGLAHPLKAQKEFKANTHMSLEPTDSEVCALSVAQMEEKYGIKMHVLETIASVESGIWDNESGKFISWPWTINVEGKGYHFATKEEAIKRVRELQVQGIKSIDVGCMQVSLKFHGDSFDNLEDAFSPEKNVEYSAQFLQKLYNKKGSWQKAAMAYHSKDPTHARVYKNKLLRRFNKMKFAFLDYHQDISLF